jgi:hypothetical protein
MKIKFTINMYTHILDTICSQYKRISKPVLVVYNVRFPGKGNNSNFTKSGLTKVAEHHSCTESIPDCISKQSLGELIAR